MINFFPINEFLTFVYYVPRICALKCRKLRIVYDYNRALLLPPHNRDLLITDVSEVSKSRDDIDRIVRSAPTHKVVIAIASEHFPINKCLSV